MYEIDPDPLFTAPTDHKLLCEESDCLEFATSEYGRTDDEGGRYNTYRCATHPADARHFERTI